MNRARGAAPGGWVPRHEAGVALVETLIAAVIICAMLVAWLQSAATAAATERMIADRRAATLIARSALEAASAVAADPQLVSGGATTRFRWQVAIEPYADGAGPRLQRATVTVTAVATGRPLVTLSTLRLAR